MDMSSGTSAINDYVIVTDSGSDESSNHISSLIELDFVRCVCCGLTEECTLSYIETIRQRYGGKWICGLCSEAVKDESVRGQGVLTPDEAMARHSSFCDKFRSSSPPQDPALHLIRAMRHILMKGSKSLRSLPSSPTNGESGIMNMKKAVLMRSESCMPSLAVVEDASSVYGAGGTKGFEY